MKQKSILCKSLQVLFTITEVFGALIIPCGVFVLAGGLLGSSHFARLHLSSYSLDPVGVEFDTKDFQLTSATIAAEKIRFAHLQGAMYLLHPTDQGELNRANLPPLGVLLIACGTYLLAISDLFRRLFRNAGRGEVFTSVNVRHMRWMGALLILNGVSFWLIIRWRAAATLAFIHGNLSVKGVSFVPIRQHTWAGMVHGVIVGLIVFAFAEVFNQGRALKQDNDLTV